MTGATGTNVNDIMIAIASDVPRGRRRPGDSFSGQMRPLRMNRRSSPLDPL